MATKIRSAAAGRSAIAAATALLAAVNLAGCTGATGAATSTSAAASSPSSSASSSAAAPSSDASTATGGATSASASASATGSSTGGATGGATAGPAVPSPTDNRCAAALPYDTDFVAAVNDYVGGVANVTGTMTALSRISSGLSEVMKGADLANLSIQDKAITSLGIQIGIYQRTLGQSEQKQGQALSAALVSHVAVQQACNEPRGRGCDAALAMSYAGVLAVQTVSAEAIADFQRTITNAALLAEGATGLETGARETAIQRTAAALTALKGAAEQSDQAAIQTALKGLQQARTGLEQACGATSAPSAQPS